MVERLDNEDIKPQCQDSDELQVKDECNRRWVGGWKKAVKKARKK
jgi:hypothetical protein